MFLIKEESGGLPSARRFVTLRASGNNVIRKLEVHGLSVQAVAKALRATEKRMPKSLSKNKEMNDSSTNS